MISPGFIGRPGPDPRATEPLHEPPTTGALVDVLGEPLVEALCLAALAPSAHNAQPWLVLVHSPEHWSLALAPDRRLPVVDPGDREALVSLGAFLENLVVAASGLGVEIRVEGYGERPDDPEVVRLGLYPGAAPFPCMTAAMVSRRTLRTPFASRPPDDRDMAELTRGVPGLTWIPGGTPQGEHLRELVIGSVRRQVERDDALSELAGWLRWSPRDAAAHRDGLTPAALGLGRLAGWYASRFFGHDTALSGRFRKHTVSQAEKLTSACGGWIVISALAPGVAGCVAAGRALERLFLRARGLGIGVHPMSQPLEEAGWVEDLEATLRVTGFPRVLLRIGYTQDYPPPVSPRLPPAAFTRVLYRSPGTHRRQGP